MMKSIVLLISLPFLGVSVPLPANQAADDADVLAVIAAKDSGEVALGQLALTKGQSSGVKELGRMLVRDHSGHLKSVNALAARLKIPITGSAAAAKEFTDQEITLARLSAMDASEFDTAFLDLNREIHAGLLQELREEMIPAAQEKAVQQMLRAMQPTLSAHLAVAMKYLKP